MFDRGHDKRANRVATLSGCICGAMLGVTFALAMLSKFL